MPRYPVETTPENSALTASTTGTTPSLARSEAAELLHLIAENVPQVFFLMSADCRQMLYMSPAFERVWQMPREAVFRDALCWLERIHPDDLWLFDPSSGQAPLARAPDHEYRLVMPDGTIIVRAKTKSVRELAGIVKLPKGKRVAIEDMNPWRR